MEPGERIREARLSKGLTLEAVGKAVGVGKSTVRKWETGMIRNMGRDKIAALSGVLGLPVTALLPGAGEAPDARGEPALTEEERRLLAAWRRADPMWRRVTLYNLISHAGPEK